MNQLPTQRSMRSFRSSVALCLALIASVLLWPLPTIQGETVPPLTTAQQVLDLGLDTARSSILAVRLQGLVTYPDPGINMIYVQDSSAGIRVVYTNANYQPASGQMVVVEGIVAGGMFAPFIDCSNVRVVGF